MRSPATLKMMSFYIPVVVTATSIFYDETVCYHCGVTGNWVAITIMRTSKQTLIVNHGKLCEISPYTDQKQIHSKWSLC